MGVQYVLYPFNTVKSAESMYFSPAIIGARLFFKCFLRPESEEGHEDYLDDLGRESGCGLRHCVRSVALLPLGPLFANLDNILPHGRNCDYYNLFVLACKSAFFSSYILKKCGLNQLLQHLELLLVI